MMKTRVNLYTQEFQPKQERLSLNHVLAISLASLVLMLVLVFVARQDTATVQAQVGMAKLQLTELEEEVQGLTTKVAQHVQNPALEQQLALLNSRLQYRHDVLSQLSSLALVQSSGFSILMSDLARLRDKDIRLSQIRLAGETMTLVGIARNHAAIPRWIRLFEKGTSLEGREFNKLHITRNSDDIIAFTLTTNLAKEVAQ